MKKIVAILLTLIMVIGCSATAFAANAPTLTLEQSQYNSNGERHIKVSWTGDSKACTLEIDDNAEFVSPEVKTRSLYNISRNGKCYNFVLSENVDATYYIRIRYSNSEEWSNVVVAEINEVEIEDKEYPSFSFLPNIDLSKLDFSHLVKNIDWDSIIPKFYIPTLKNYK